MLLMCHEDDAMMHKVAIMHEPHHKHIEGVHIRPSMCICNSTSATFRQFRP